LILADYLLYCLDDHLLHPFPLSTDRSPQGREGTLKSHVPESPGCFLPDPPVFITQCRNNRIDRGLVPIPGERFDRLPSGGGIGIADETDKMRMLLSLPGLFLLIHTVEMADKEKKGYGKRRIIPCLPGRDLGQLFHGFNNGVISWSDVRGAPWNLIRFAPQNYINCAPRFIQSMS